jgi:SAM-dependent methyltransferase
MAASHAVQDTAPPRFRRYLSDQPQRFDAYLKAAEEYVDRLDVGAFNSLYQKPFDLNPGNPSFYQNFYQVLNLLKAMNVRPAGRVVEVGSGPGWLTEILMGMGFEVDAIEPSDAMIRIARDRVASCIEHHRILNPPRVTFHCRPFEECDLPEESADAVLFHESLHHVIDEDRALSLCYRLLCPGGVLGVSGDSAWQPGNPDQKEFWDGEMERFGTLENPFTWDYLNYLLNKHGFREVRRYHGVNGLFPVEDENLTVKGIAQFPADSFNNVTARKPGVRALTTADPYALTRGEIRLLEARHDPGSLRADLRVSLTNRGETTWLRGGSGAGSITLALAQGKPGRYYDREAHPRCRLPQDLAPGEDLVMEATFSMPEGYGDGPWYLDLVNERLFWLSHRGTSAAEVCFT